MSEKSIIESYISALACAFPENAFSDGKGVGLESAY